MRTVRSYRHVCRFQAYDPRDQRVRLVGVVALSRGVTFSTARVVIVADKGCGDALTDAMARMGVASVQRVHSLDAARELCAAGNVDACLVLLPRAVPDESPSWTANSQAPGRGRLPALLLAEAVTHHVTNSARFAGYAAVAPLGLPPRMLYRCIGALLQIARGKAGGAVDGHKRPPPPRTIRGIGPGRGEAPGTRKPRLQ